MSAKKIDYLLEIWALDKAKHDDLAPFNSYAQMYSPIDAIEFGDAPWQSFSMKFSTDEDHPADTPWKSASYEVWYRDPVKVISNLLDNPDFDGQFDYSAFVEVDKQGQRRWNDFMSGNWAWRRSVSAISICVFVVAFSYHRHRPRYTKRTNQGRAACSAPLFSVVTRPLCLSQLGMLNTTRFTFQSAMYITPFEGLTATQWYQLDS